MPRTKTIKTTQSDIQPTSTNSLNLPESFEVSLPEIVGYAQAAIGFSPNESLPRVTDVQRSQDEIIYREQINAAKNLTDSIKVADQYVRAGIAATKLGKSLIEYQVGIQHIKTAETQLSKAVVGTEIMQGELNELLLKRNLINDSLPHIESEYQSILSEVKERAVRASYKAQAFINETQALYQTNNEVRQIT